MRRHGKRHFFSRLTGILLIVTSVLVFTRSVEKRMKKSMSEPRAVSERSDIRITADSKTGNLFLWGLEDGLTLRADVPITYHYEAGFYIISIGEIFKPYLLEVFEGDERKRRFSYRPGESYPIFPY